MTNSLRRRDRTEAAGERHVMTLLVAGGSSDAASVRGSLFNDVMSSILVERGELLVSQSASPGIEADNRAIPRCAGPLCAADDVGVVEEREPREAKSWIVSKHLCAPGRCACPSILTRWKPTDQPTYFTSLAAFPAASALAASAHYGVPSITEARVPKSPRRYRYGVLPW